MTAAAGQVAQVLIGGEAAVDDPDAAPEPPTAQVVLDLPEDGLVVGVAGPHPHPHRDPLARDRQPDHHLRQVGAVILRVPERPERRLLLLARGAVGLGFEVGRGGVEEEQIDLEVQEVGAGEEDGLLHLRLRVGLDQQVERAVGVVASISSSPGIATSQEAPWGAQIRSRCKSRHSSARSSLCTPRAGLSPLIERNSIRYSLTSATRSGSPSGGAAPTDLNV